MYWKISAEVIWGNKILEGEKKKGENARQKRSEGKEKGKGRKKNRK
jgi:hypothetical protein